MLMREQIEQQRKQITELIMMIHNLASEVPDPKRKEELRQFVANQLLKKT